MKLFVKKSLNKELYQSVKKEHLIDYYFKNPNEPYEEVINITLDEEEEEKIDFNEANFEDVKNFNLKNNLDLFDNYNSEIKKKIEKYNEEYNCNVNCNSYLYDEKNNFSNNSNFDIYKLRENSNQTFEAKSFASINYHNFAQIKNAASGNTNNGKII